MRFLLTIAVLFVMGCIASQLDRKYTLRRVIWTVERIDSLSSRDKSKVYVITWTNSKGFTEREEVEKLSWETVGYQVIGFDIINR